MKGEQEEEVAKAGYETGALGRSSVSLGFSALGLSLGCWGSRVLGFIGSGNAVWGCIWLPFGVLC